MCPTCGYVAQGDPYTLAALVGVLMFSAGFVCHAAWVALRRPHSGDRSR